MSGNPTGSNVVPMPHAAAAPTPAQPPMPFPMWAGGGSLPWGPGCCPPGGMDALMKCYCDVQAATAFICSVMVQCVQQNPAVTAAIIAAIEASGSSLPTTGVTNGSDAQPGQVGEWVQFFQEGIAFPATANTQVVSLGVLNPGDWDCWAYIGTANEYNDIEFELQPLPAGFSGALGSTSVEYTGEVGTVLAPTVRALTTVPSLIAFRIATNTAGTGSGAGVLTLIFNARRRR